MRTGEKPSVLLQRHIHVAGETVLLDALAGGHILDVNHAVMVICVLEVLTSHILLRINKDDIVIVRNNSINIRIEVAVRQTQRPVGLHILAGNTQIAHHLRQLFLTRLTGFNTAVIEARGIQTDTWLAVNTRVADGVFLPVLSCMSKEIVVHRRKSTLVGLDDIMTHTIATFSSVSLVAACSCPNTSILGILVITLGRRATIGVAPNEEEPKHEEGNKIKQLTTEASLRSECPTPAFIRSEKPDAPRNNLHHNTLRCFLPWRMKPSFANPHMPYQN